MKANPGLWPGFFILTGSKKHPKKAKLAVS